MITTHAARTLKHRRQFSVEFYSRNDGLWDIEARLTDVKTYDIQLRTGKLPANRPIHHLLVRLTVDLDGNIIEADAIFEGVPFAGHCEAIAPAYKKLIGLNLLADFRHAIRDRFAGIDGCAHINELAMILPDAAMQVLPFEKRRNIENSESDKKPFELDSCHALRTDGPAVAKYYPNWKSSK